ncbi:hypothetical protein SAMN05216214_11574 [Atopomonas hussainii]|uniref:Membrane-bound metal-dependent hydrolase n=1 Tax=Atopomonas hussainii TaxID=1429083 RepID=A0A1H7RQA6_9GAMM|nr:DUF6122 family protein [Atopomonas hussainii]SEL62178.1 hypothetical protein SAMN05216214_11574 [Atopomonas hussainii]
MSAASVIHLLLHALVPAAVVWFCWRKQWRVALAVMLATMAVDLDHLVADPIFAANRCSLGFHPLHSAPWVWLYPLLLLCPKPIWLRWIGAGLVIHMLLDGSDCWRMAQGW